MDEKERFDTNREAQHDAVANREQSSQRRADVITRFIGALLYSGARQAERKREGRDQKTTQGERDDAAT